MCVWVFTWVISGCPRRRYRCIRWCSRFWSRGESVGQLCKSFFVVFNFKGFNNLARFGRHHRCKKSCLWWSCYCRSRVRGDPLCWTFVTVLNFKCPLRIICLYKGILLKVTLLLKLWHCSIKLTMFILILKSFTNSCIIAIRYIVSNIYILILQYDFDYLKELEKIKKLKLKWI